MSNPRYLLMGAFALALSAGIFYTSQVDAVSFPNGTLLKSPVHASIYQYENGTRRSFPSQSAFYSYYPNFKNVKTITVEEMESIELGKPMSVKPNTYLLKFPLNPKTYAVTSDLYLQHIPDAGTAVALYGDKWEDKIIEVNEVYSLFYAKGSALEKKTVTTPIKNSGQQYSTQTVESLLNSNATITEDLKKLKNIDKSQLNENGQLVLRDDWTRTSYYYKGKMYTIHYSVFNDWYADNISISLLSGKDYDNIGESENRYVCDRAGSLVRFAIDGSANASNNWKGENSDIYYIANNCIIHKVPSEAWVKKWYGVYTDKENDLEPTKFTVNYANVLYKITT